MPEKLRQPLLIDSVPDHRLLEPFPTGIYNRAVLMLARRTKYNATLLKELATIEKTPDDLLERTALRHVFVRDSIKGQSVTQPPQHEAVVADTTPLNAEQRLATASLLKCDVTVVTVPPGTGKSQVVSSAVANARLLGQTILFASRNHKAIDAVIGRLSDADGQSLSLIVRTNSRDDPNLSVTFGHAIREMLAEQGDLAVVERLERTKEELNSLLEERGRAAGEARLASEIGTALGELEERLSHLARTLSAELVIFLDMQADQFPTNSVRKVAQAIRSLAPKTQNPSIFSNCVGLCRVLSVYPAYRSARNRLRGLPSTPILPGLPTPRVFRGLQTERILLERAMEYARLRSECRSMENRIMSLPPLEETSNAVAELSQRIAEVVKRAVSLDLGSRRGLPPGADREELSGLRAALNAMRTGLDDGVIRAETVRVLEERIPHILQAFPCWAVTNLSVGSRIPLVSGIFDLAIVDEASH